MTTLYPSGYKVKNVNIMHKWVRGEQSQHYSQVVKRIKMSILDTSS